MRAQGHKSKLTKIRHLEVRLAIVRVLLPWAGSDFVPAPLFFQGNTQVHPLAARTSPRRSLYPLPLALTRHASSSFQALLKSLLLYLAESNPEIKGGASGRVNPTTGDIELLGHWKKDVCEFLLARGM